MSLRVFPAVVQNKEKKHKRYLLDVRIRKSISLIRRILTDRPLKLWNSDKEERCQHVEVSPLSQV